MKGFLLHDKGFASLGYNYGKDSIYTLYGRLTDKLTPKIRNLIPDDMDSPADILATDYEEDDFFYGFETPPPAESKIININSGISFEPSTMSELTCLILYLLGAAVIKLILFFFFINI